jgi:dTDP-4-dehydrorhamnose 3,5-epimerase
MKIQPLAIPGSLLLIPEKLPDARGFFYESFKHDALAEAAGHPFTPTQTNFSVSRRGVLRGLHSVLIPPGQAKIVTCHRGAILDMVVDLRLGSPTFGEHSATILDAESGCCAYVAEGLSHGFLALAGDTCVGYLCSTQHLPGTQLDVNPFDPDLALPWNAPERPIVSEKDASAPTVAAAMAAGLLPTYQECLALYDSLSTRPRLG